MCLLGEYESRIVPPPVVLRKEGSGLTRTWLRAKKIRLLKWICPDGGTGRRAGLKIRFSQESGSSTLPLGTIRSQRGSSLAWVLLRFGGDRIVRESESN